MATVVDGSGQWMAVAIAQVTLSSAAAAMATAVMVAAPAMMEVTAEKVRIERISYISDILIQLLNLTC